jgi:hypothetical protein
MPFRSVAHFRKQAGRTFMSDVVTLLAGSTYRVESISETPIFSALAATHPLFSSSTASPDTSRRASTHREPAWLSRSCLVQHSPMGGRHRRSSTLAERAPRSGRHHLSTPSYA